MMVGDLTMLVTNNHIADSLDYRAQRQLRAVGHIIAGLRVNTVFLWEYIKEKGRVARPAIVLSAHRVTTTGGFFCTLKS